MEPLPPTRSSRRRKSIGARGVVLIAIVIAMLFSSVYPLGRYLSLKREIAALQTEEQRLDDTLDALQDERATLLTDAEVERLARERLGYVRPGEKAYVIADPKLDEAEAAPLVPVEEAATPDDDGMLGRWWRAIQQVARSS